MNNTIISMVHGLFELHSKGVVHDDLRPSRVLFTEEGYAKMGDFGIARLTEEVDDLASRYASPERHDGRARTKASDAWSLGVTIYEMLSGQSAFQGPMSNLMGQIALDERPAVPGIACPELAEVIRSCWKKDEAERMTMMEIVEKLSGAGWNLVEGADPKATKACLYQFLAECSSSRAELEAKFEAQAEASRFEGERSGMESRVEGLEAEIARLKQALGARVSENEELKAEIAALRAKESTVQPCDVVRVPVGDAARMRSLELPAQRPGVVPLKGDVTEVHLAARRRDVATILGFATRPEFIEAEDASGQTPMWWAACVGKSKAVKALGSLGANVGTPNERGATPVFIASQGGHEATVRTLASLGANVNTPANDGTTPVCVASQNGHEPVVRALASLGANVNTPRNDGITPVFIASQKGHESTVRALASLGANVNRPGDDGWTPLMIASQNDRVAVVAALLEAGASVTGVLPAGRTALSIAESGATRRSSPSSRRRERESFHRPRDSISILFVLCLLPRLHVDSN
jgi:ankyrin repeat protein